MHNCYSSLTITFPSRVSPAEAFDAAGHWLPLSVFTLPLAPASAMAF